MTSWSIPETDTTVLHGFDPAWLPAQAARYVTVRVQRREGGGETVALEAGPYVGALPLTTGETLYIVPRVGKRMLTRMLAITERLESEVRKEFERFVNLGHADDDTVSWLQLLARTFLDQLRLIEVSSLRAERETIEERRASVRGRVLLVPTLMSLGRREEEPLHCAYSVPTYATAEHRVLGKAATQLLRMRVAEPGERELTAQRWSARFGQRPLALDDHVTVTRALNAGRYTGSRSYYIGALVMAQLILWQGGLTLDDTNTSSTESFLTNMPVLFERYIRVTLRTAFSEKGYVVEKRETRGPTLFADGTAELTPDVIISDAGGDRLLIDAKYKLKEGIEASDYYQMAAYLRGFHAQHGMIVRPRLTTQPFPIVHRRMNSGGVVHELNLGMTNWAGTEQALIAGVTQALAAGPLAAS